MLEVLARDFGARLSRWTTSRGEVRLPAVAEVHTERQPASPFAELVLSRAMHPTLPTIVAQGTRFSPDEPVDGPETVPKSLVYPADAGTALLEAADRLNAGGSTVVVHAPATLSSHDGIVVLATARTAARDAWRLPALLVEARRRAGPNAVLFAPGLGRPDEMALAAYAGVDVFDGLVPILEGLQGRYLTPEGPIAPPGNTAPCACDACRKAEGAWTQLLLGSHNVWACQAEARRIRQAIASGSLRELVESRVRAAPELVAMLRRYDVDQAGFFEERAPALSTRTLPIVSRESLSRPEIRRWLGRLETRYRSPPEARVLVVLPCSATKPYSNSATHHALRPPVLAAGRGRVHVVTLTSPLGAVPEELEMAYPAARYDIPVTGTWFEEERRICARAFAALARVGPYEHVILHVPPIEADLVADVFPKAERTLHEGEEATSEASLTRLRAAVGEAAKGYAPVPRRKLFEDHMRSRIDWQFGRGVGEHLLEHATIVGKHPLLRIVSGSHQVALFQPDRGALTLTAEGARRLARATDAYTVSINDFAPRGTVFAAGVASASPDIRVEDEVIVKHGDELRAVGRALASGSEMGELKRGPVVEVRHRVG